MTVSADRPEEGDEPRPTGLIRPAHERAVRALAALDEQRVPDAEKHADQVPESSPIDRAWKLYLRSRVAIERLDFDVAEPLLLQVFFLGYVNGMGAEGAPDGDALRLAACALHHAGWICRRRDRADEAYRIHLAAFHLRESHGSFEELWETATDLGVDADVARRPEAAQGWYRAALEAAAKSSQRPKQKQAITWGHAADSLIEAGEYDRAVEAARSARECRRRHDPGDAEAAKADMTLGYALLKRGESLHDTDQEAARSVLVEAIESLTSAQEALLPFGPAYAADVQWCLDQKDFAKRLCESLDA